MMIIWIQEYYQYPARQIANPLNMNQSNPHDSIKSQKIGGKEKPAKLYSISSMTSKAIGLGILARRLFGWYADVFP